MLNDIYPPIDGGPLGAESSPGGSGIVGAVGGLKPLASVGFGDDSILGIGKFGVCEKELAQPSFPLILSGELFPSLLKFGLGGGPPKCPCP